MMKNNIQNHFMKLRIDHLSDGRSIGLSKMGELLAYRAIMLMIWMHGNRLPVDTEQLLRAIGQGMSPREFRQAFSEIQKPEFGLFELIREGAFFHCPKLSECLARSEEISTARSVAGKKGGMKPKSKSKEKTQIKKSKPVSISQPKKNYIEAKRNLFEEIYLSNLDE